MSLSITFTGSEDGDDGPFALASASGWALLSEWAMGLPPGRFSALVRLAGTGEVRGTDRLSRDLRRALKEHPPDNPAVADTIQGLLENLGVGAADETATVLGE